MRFRIITILFLLSFPIFAKEGEVRHKEIRITLNEAKTIYIIPQFIVDIADVLKRNNRLDDMTSINISVIFEF